MAKNIYNSFHLYECHRKTIIIVQVVIGFRKYIMENSKFVLTITINLKGGSADKSAWNQLCHL